MRRAKIVATLGPALDDPARLRAALAAGIDVVRLNFSHGTAEDHRNRLEEVRRIAAELGRPIGSLGDLQGPKIRLGDVPDPGVELQEGGEVVFVSGAERLDAYEEDGVPVLPVVYEYLAVDVETGSLVLMDDGLLRTVVSSVEGDRVRARVVVGGVAKARKGVNLPGVEVSAASMTDKDREDVATMVELGVDWIALSFVRTARDIHELREIIVGHGGVQPIVAKLERPEAVDNLEEIVGDRRHHGGSGRPRRGDRSGAGAVDPEGDDRPGQPLVQAGHHRHGDAGLDDPQPPSDPRRGVGRGQRDLRRYRRRDADW